MGREGEGPEALRRRRLRRAYETRRARERGGRSVLVGSRNLMEEAGVSGDGLSARFEALSVATMALSSVTVVTNALRLRRAKV